MNPTLQGYADAVLGGAGAEALSRLADELAAVVGLVDSTDALYIALTDTSLPGAERRAIVDDLLRGRVSDPARRAAAFTAGAVAAPEVPAALDWVAHQAYRHAQGESVDPLTLGRLAVREQMAGFATALYEDASTGGLEEMEDELFRFARTVEATTPLRAVLTDRERPAAARQGVVGDLLRDKVQPFTLRMLDYVVQAGRPRDLIGTIDWLVERTAEARGWRVARVHSAREIDAAQRERLASSLQRLTGMPVELQITLEPALLGGAVVQVGNIQVDASAEGRLERLREHLALGEWEPRPAGSVGTSGAAGSTGTGGAANGTDTTDRTGTGGAANGTEGEG